MKTRARAGAGKGGYLRKVGIMMEQSRGAETEGEDRRKARRAG